MYLVPTDCPNVPVLCAAGRQPTHGKRDEHHHDKYRLCSGVRLPRRTVGKLRQPTVVLRESGILARGDVSLTRQSFCASNGYTYGIAQPVNSGTIVACGCTNTIASPSDLEAAQVSYLLGSTVGCGDAAVGLMCKSSPRAPS